MNIADIIARQAKALPESPAVIENGRSFSYRDFDAAIWRAADAFHCFGLRQGDVACISLPNGALHLAANYALARLGVIHLELGPQDLGARGWQLARRFSARAILAADDASSIPGLPQIVADPGWLAPTGAVAQPPPAPGGSAGWKISLTSGTTGVPKATLISHAMQAFWCEANHCVVPANPQDRYLVVIGLDLDSGLRHCLCVQWGGGAVVFEPPMNTSEAFFETAERVGATYLSLTPKHLAQMLPACKEDRPRLPGVRVLRSGGMLHTEQLRRDVRRRITPNFYLMYGTNDGGAPATCSSGDMIDRHPESLGLPCPGVEIGIVDDSGAALPAGDIGLVRIRAPGTPRQYIDNPEATARCFRDGWYYPGDLGWLSADGFLHFKGRVDEMMNYDGLKIYPGEIEAALLAHPQVAEAAAFALPSETHQDIPVAMVVARSGLRLAMLRRYCIDRLGPRAPQQIAVAQALPRNAAGKVDKRELVRMLNLRAEATAKRLRRPKNT